MNDLVNKKDLTRWNRSGLSRFRYIDGNAITYLETLRLAMTEVFTDEKGNNQWQALDDIIKVPEQETAKQRQQRWLAQYRGDRRDHAWEIMRTYARSLHVLTEHMDAYANETFLNTASQWDNVRRLVEMLDYHPAPPASAESWLVLLAKSEKTGLLDKGFAAKNKPEDGSKAAVFETFNDLEVDASLNVLRAKDWNKSQTLFSVDAGLFPLIEPLEGVSVGTHGILIIERKNKDDIGLAIEVTGLSDQNVKFKSEKTADKLGKVFLYQVRLLLKPSYKQAPRINGNNTVIVQEEHGLSANTVIAWQQGSVWKAANILEVEGNRIRLSIVAPSKNTKLYLTAFSDNTKIKTKNGFKDGVLVPTEKNGSRVKKAVWDRDIKGLNFINHLTEKESKLPLYDYRTGQQRIYYIPSVENKAEIATRVVISKPQDITFEGSPGNLTSNDWVLLVKKSENKAAYIKALEEKENDFTIKLSLSPHDFDTLYGDFKFDLRAKDYDVNNEPVFLKQLSQRSNQHSFIKLDLESFPDLLVIGRELIVAGEGDATKVTVVDVDKNIIKIEPAIAGSKLLDDGSTDYYSRHQTTIYANVVACGHGETQTSKILGSGDATKTNQQFVFDIKEVSFISDADFSSGVRAAIDIVVEGRTWKQVSTLIDSDPEDPHYQVQMNEDGTLIISFGGDGRGRRLPSGNNNVRISYRKGTGLNGNLPAYAVNKVVKPHYLIDSVIQPIVSSGGNDLEAIESLKDNAPASVLALERAVSLSDFTHLAASNSSVWQAKAFRVLPGKSRSDKIEVAVVPANGGELGSLKTILQEFLANHALPGVSITVVPYRSIILDLIINFTLKEDEFNVDIVSEQVRLTVLAAFILQNRPLGEALYRSQVYEVVEGVTGVANCQCQINPARFIDANGQDVIPSYVVRGADQTIKRISTDRDQLIYMDESLSTLEINASAFTL